MFVYLWTNNINNKKYIGRCAKSIHSNYKGSGKYFKRALKKYGEENFTRQILKRCDSIDECKKWEQYYLDLYDAANDGNFYNIMPNSHGGHHGADYNKEKNPMWKKKHPNHKPHYGKNNGMYGISRKLSENPNSKKCKIIKSNGEIILANSIKEACIKIFGTEIHYDKIKYLITNTANNKSQRKDNLLFGWKGYYI